MPILSRLIEEAIFALIMGCALVVMGRQVRRWLHFRYIVIALIVLVVIVAISGGR